MEQKSLMYPQTEFLKIPVILCFSIGMFPRELMFEKNQHFQKFYSIYSKFMFGLYIFYLTTTYIKIYQVSTKDNPSIDEISGILCTSLIYTITLVRQLIIRFHTGLRSIIKQIIDSENIIYAQDSEEIINIYNDSVTDTKRNCILYPASIFLTTTLFMCRPFFAPGYEIENGNQTIFFIKSLPIIAWFPVDEQIYYKEAYFWQVIMSMLGAVFVSYTDILMISLIIYPTVQLKIMQYVLRNFEMYKQKIKLQIRVDDNTAAFATFREYIVHHKNVIRYVENFNDSMNTLMVFDFLQSSLQIAAVLAQVLGNEITPILAVCVSSYVIGMLLRLFMYYHYANEVIILSGGLADSIWDTNWYEQPTNVKLMMLIFIIRAQKNLQLQIGPFSVMSLDSLIAILKATYSYITIIYGTN